jgi:hypothetical protein
MSEYSASVPEAQQQVPEYNAVEKLNGILYSIGAVTKNSRIPHAENNPHRPLWLRAKRAELYRRLSNKSSVPEKIFAEARARDEIASQYLSQGDVLVNMPGLGEQRARYTLIEPPDSRKSLENGPKPPIFLIPGMSNDIDCVGALTQELPYEGRNVIVVGFPESFMGSTTEGFAKAVEESKDYSPHVEFYKNAIKALLGEHGDIELWGFSTGSPIIAQILNDAEYQQRVTNAVFIAPASCVDQSSLQLSLGTAHETKEVLKEFGSSGKYTLTGINRGLQQLDKPHMKLRTRILKAMYKRAGQKSPWYAGARVKEGGNIVVVSGGNDEITKSYKAKDTFSENPQMIMLEDPKWHHSTSLLHPERVVPKILNRQKNGN